MVIFGFWFICDFPVSTTLNIIADNLLHLIKKIMIVLFFNTGQKITELLTKSVFLGN